MKIVSARFLFFILFFFFSSNLFASVFVVCTSGCGYTSIQAAVDAASNGDTVLVNVAGSLTESRISVSKNLVIRGLGQYQTIVQAHAQRGAARHRIFYITGGAVVVLENMTLQNGRETADFTNRKGGGGGILIDGSSTHVTLNQITIRHCDNVSAGGNGAGIVLGGNSTTLQMNNCLLDNNISNNGSGGGLYVAAPGGDCFVRNTSFKNNIAANGNGGGVLPTKI